MLWFERAVVFICDELRATRIVVELAAASYAVIAGTYLFVDALIVMQKTENRRLPVRAC